LIIQVQTKQAGGAGVPPADLARLVLLPASYQPKGQGKAEQNSGARRHAAGS